MRKKTVIAAAMVAAWTVAGLATPDGGDGRASAGILMTYVGQVVNGSPTAASSQQYGNLLGVAGADASSSFTFYTEAVTTSTVANGPLRIVERTGNTTIYLAPEPGSFDAPESFRAGTPVQLSTLRQQVIVDTSTGLFTVVNVNTITETRSFSSGGESVSLGQQGRSFRTQLTGHLNTPGGAPTGWFGGWAVRAE